MHNPCEKGANWFRHSLPKSRPNSSNDIFADTAIRWIKAFLSAKDSWGIYSAKFLKFTFGI